MNKYDQLELLTGVGFGCLNSTLTKYLVHISLAGICRSVKKIYTQFVLYYMIVKFASMIQFVQS